MAPVGRYRHTTVRLSSPVFQSASIFEEGISWNCAISLFVMGIFNTQYLHRLYQNRFAWIAKFLVNARKYICVYLFLWKFKDALLSIKSVGSTVAKYRHPPQENSMIQSEKNHTRPTPSRGFRAIGRRKDSSTKNTQSTISLVNQTPLLRQFIFSQISKLV